MAQVTPKLALFKPELRDRVADSIGHLAHNFQALDDEFLETTGHDHKTKGGAVGRIRSGSEAGRPTAGMVAGDIYYATDTNRLYVFNGTRWVRVDSLLELLPQKGDLVVGGGAGTLQRVPVGQDGYVLVASSAAPGGVTWTNMGTAAHGVITDPLDLHPIYTTEAEVNAIVDTRAISAALLQAKGDLVGASGANTPARVPAPSRAGQVLRADPAQATGLNWSSFVLLEATKTIGFNVGDFVEFWQFTQDFYCPNLAWLFIDGPAAHGSVHIWIHAFNLTAGAWQAVPPLVRDQSGSADVKLLISVGPNSNTVRVRVQRVVADTAARNVRLVLLLPSVTGAITDLTGSGNAAVVTTELNRDFLPLLVTSDGQARQAVLAGSLSVLSVAQPAAPASGSVIYHNSATNRLEARHANGDAVDLQVQSTGLQYLAWAGM
jgi:hypothetical protein